MDLEPLDRAGPPAPSWAPSLTTRLLRNPRTYWLAAIALVVVTVVTIHHLTTSAANLRSAYGETTEVAVLTRQLAAGDPFAGNIDLRSMPRALVPDHAMSEVGPEATASGAISGGAILTSQDIASTSALPSHLAAVVVPVGATTPPLAVGQQVLVIVHGDVFAGIEGGLVEAVVHTASPEQVLVTVERSDLLVVSSALAGNGVTLALT